jgi:hypothetical protein
MLMGKLKYSDKKLSQYNFVDPDRFSSGYFSFTL